MKPLDLFTVYLIHTYYAICAGEESDSDSTMCDSPASAAAAVS